MLKVSLASCLKHSCEQVICICTYIGLHIFMLYRNSSIIVQQKGDYNKQTLLDRREAGQMYTNELLKARMEWESSSKVCNKVH